MPMNAKCRSCAWTGRVRRLTGTEETRGRCPSCERIGTLNRDTGLKRDEVQGHPIHYITIRGDA